ncbi:MAG: hypothetical protein SangKO_073920 [Sandaracinaceae bacterium]
MPAVLTSSNAGWRNHVEWTFTSSHGTDRPYWYVLRLRPGYQPGPGAYQAVAGLSFDHLVGVGDPDNYPDCMTVPFDDITLRGGAASFALDGDLSSPDLCGVVGPVPLEDEIIDDHDQYEDSWRHHLDVAARTAAHSDEMGQRLLQSGLEMDARAERALEDLIDLCGVPINLDSLFNSDGSAGTIDLSQLVDGTCDEATGTPACASGFQCVGNSCVSQMLAAAGATSHDVEAILACLGLDAAGESNVVPVVALGSDPLCAWHRMGAPNILCEGAQEPGECPYPAVDTDGMPGLTVGDCSVPMGSTAVPILIDDGHTLGLYQHTNPENQPTGGSPGGEQPDVPDCNQVRFLRNTPARGPQREIIRSGFYSYENVRYWARRIGWRGLPLDFSEVTVDGARWADAEVPARFEGATGYPWMGGGPTADGTWPCGQALTGTLCASGDRSLFCDYASSCANSAERARMNRRLGRAATTLGVLSGNGLSQVQLPAHYLNLDIDPGGARHSEEILDYLGNPWLFVSNVDYGDDSLSGAFLVPPTNTIVWTSQGATALETHGTGSATTAVSRTRPFGFVNFGHSAGDEGITESIARALWDGFQTSGPKQTLSRSTP